MAYRPGPGEKRGEAVKNEFDNIQESAIEIGKELKRKLDLPEAAFSNWEIKLSIGKDNIPDRMDSKLTLSANTIRGNMRGDEYFEFIQVRRMRPNEEGGKK